MQFLPQLVLIMLVLLAFAGFPKKSKKYDMASVVIPAFNEEESIEHVISAVKQVDVIDQIIVVDDGSKDNTASIVSKIPGVLLIKHRTNKGKGSAMNTGLKKVKNEVVLFLDADLREIQKQQIETIVKPILQGNADIAKTKFKREAGRVTELTAKPLLQFFFPELSFAQPLSGQFAATKTFLDKIDLENDYGVDIGIVLDAESLGMKIVEVDIGDIVHDHSTLQELNIMANEVVRTIVDRAINYGRLTMVDDLGNSIRMEIMGLSLITLGIFGIFFIKFMNLYISILIILAGLIIAIYHIVRIVKMSIHVYRRSNLSTRDMFRVFMKTHFPVVISVLILLLLMISLLGSVSITSNQISIEPVSKNMIIPTSSSSTSSSQQQQSVDVRGPYNVANALENEEDLIRLPLSASNTLQAQYGDYVYINNERYQLEQAVNHENDLLRIPEKARHGLKVKVDMTIRDSDLKSVFEDSYLVKNIKVDPNNVNNSSHLDVNHTNISVGEHYSQNATEGNILTVYVNDTEVGKTAAILNENSTYSIYINGVAMSNLNINKTTNGTIYNTTYNNSTVEVKMEPSDVNATLVFADDDSYVKFLNIHINDKNSYK